MRLLHKDLIPVLPRLQLLSQWRECCCIARNLVVNNTPNHMLVNKITDYPIDHFCNYCQIVCIEMETRGYKCDFSRLEKWIPDDYNPIDHSELFKDWHNHRYMFQCYFNLEEKYDCGGIPEEEWQKLRKYVVDNDLL